MAPDKRRVTADDLYNITHVEDPRISPDGRWIAYVQITVDRLENTYRRNLWLIPTAGGDPIQITRSGKDTQPRWSPDGGTLAFTSSRDEKSQIYLMRIEEPGGEPRLLTSLPNGANNAAWSPDSSQIAFLAPMNAAEREREDRGEQDPAPADKLEGKQHRERRDQDEIRRWDPRLVERIPYRTGTGFLTDRFAQVYIMPVAEGLNQQTSKQRRLTSVDADHNPPQWAPDGQSVLTARMGDPKADEPWRWSNLYRIRLSDGANQQLTDETFSSFNPVPSPDGQWIAFQRLPRERLSERIVRLAIMPAAGNDIRDLNLDLDRNAFEFRWVPNSTGLLFNAGSEGNVELYHVNIDTGAIERVIGGSLFIENFDVHPGAGIAFGASTPENPSELFWQASSVDHAVQMTRLNEKFLSDIHVQPTHEIRWLSPSGIEIQGWYILPRDFEPGRTYPLALNIHGGPHIMWGPAMKFMWHEWQLQAARGYVVFFCNPRGADGHGEAFQMALHGAWGDVAFADIMTGVDHLLEKGFVDADRMAVTGGSYGGYMTAWIVSHTDRFKAAVAHRGVYNLLGFSGVTDIPSFIPTEFGVEPWEDPTFLWQHSPLAHAHRIKTPLLIIHSENDYRVPISEGEQLFTYVRRSGGTVRLLRFPRDGHEMTRSGEPEHRLVSLTHTLDWFDRYCLPSLVDPSDVM